MLNIRLYLATVAALALAGYGWARIAAGVAR